MSFEPWEIWWAYVKFRESDMEKIRPVIILDDETVFVIGLYITSSSPRPGYDDYIIQDWEMAGLEKQSTVRLDERLRLSHEKILTRIGCISQRDKLLLAMRGQIKL